MANKKKADICIIGGGITGLVIAALLEQAGQDYVLIESQAELGGLLRGQKEKETWLDYGLKSVPVGEDLSENPLMKLRKALGLNLPLETWNDVPLTYSSAGLGPFMGFGEAKNRFLVEELSYYTQTPRLLVSGGWRVLIEELIKLIPENRRITKTYVTKLNVQDDSVVSVTLNGDTTFTADRFIFTLSPLLLRELLIVGAVTPKTIQRIARTSPLTAVSLDIAVTKKITDAKNLFVFQENSKIKNEDPFFVIGQFVSNADPVRHEPETTLSTWMTFVDPESLEDDENASKTIKTMSKLIKKVFPALIEEKVWQRLLVVPGALGQFEQMVLESDLTLPGLGNLWMAGGKNPANASKGSSTKQAGPLHRNLGVALETALQIAAQMSPKAVAESSLPLSPENNSAPLT